jgi:hypothetical protein
MFVVQEINVKDKRRQDTIILVARSIMNDDHETLQAALNV